MPYKKKYVTLEEAYKPDAVRTDSAHYEISKPFKRARPMIIAASAIIGALWITPIACTWLKLLALLNHMFRFF